MFKNSLGKLLTAFLLSTGIATPALVHAGAFDGGDWTKQAEGRVIEYLIITANYESPRALAEAIQEETGNPILLLPPVNSQEGIFLLLPDGKKPAQADPDQLSAYIMALNPKRVLIIGDATIVPPEYRMSVNKKYEIVTLSSKSWVVNAIAASNLFNSKKVEERFHAKRPVQNTNTEKP